MKLINSAGMIACLLALASCEPDYNVPTGELFFDFESDAALDRIVWQCRAEYSRSDSFATHGSYSLRVEAFGGLDPGFKPQRYEPNFAKHTRLRVDIFNPQHEAVELHVKLGPRWDSPFDDRVERSIVLPPGTTHYVLDLHGLLTNDGATPLDLRSIKLVSFYLQNPQKRTVLYFDYLRLE